MWMWCCEVYLAGCSGDAETEKEGAGLGDSLKDKRIVR